jgi:hypothetical protein
MLARFVILVAMAVVIAFPVGLALAQSGPVVLP